MIPSIPQSEEKKNSSSLRRNPRYGSSKDSNFGSVSDESS